LFWNCNAKKTTLFIKSTRFFIFIVRKQNLGEHPRNWLALRELSIRLVQDAIYNLQQQTKFHCVGIGGRRAAIAEYMEKDLSFSSNSVENVSPTIVLNELYEGRRSLFMPPSLKPRSAGFQ
jgi:hypothetical protein